jgi:hypothetical protein
MELLHSPLQLVFVSETAAIQDIIGSTSLFEAGALPRPDTQLNEKRIGLTITCY